MRTRPTRLVLVGGGHTHVEVLRRFALQPESGLDLTLISPSPLAAYSGMLPGLVAGHYSVAEAHIDLLPLAQRAKARFVRDTVIGLDLTTKTLALADGDTEPFDIVSLDVGSAPDTSQVPGAREHAIAVRPAATFLAAWSALQADAAEGKVSTIAVVGGGAGGVEVLLAMQHRLHKDLGDKAPRFALITDQPQLLPEHAPAVRARFGKLLVAHGVVLHLNSGAIAVEPGTVITTHQRRIAVDRIVWATSAGAQPWLAASGLASDPRGFVQVDDTLRSKSHPFAFAAGDCATQTAHPRPKSGVFAVRQGPPLAANLRRALHNETPAAYIPQRHALALISTGGRHAVASRGPFVFEGDWVWRWKDRIDRAFMAKYVHPAMAPQMSGGMGEE
jgi:pyridine nucleotide-disulfide oxidoreductase family protein